MAVLRRRLIIWLFKAYIKKWGKAIFFSFVIGLLVFFLLLKSSSYLVKLIPQKKVAIGYAGVYTLETMPSELVGKLTRGLTKIETDGSISPDLSTKWEIKDNGKTYVFHLRPDITFSNNKKLDAKSVQYNFAGVKVDRPDKDTLVYTLKDEYAPFLVTVARPVFEKGYIGVGEYKIRDVELNGEFLTSLRIVKRNNPLEQQTYKFYPTTDALKIAFTMGEVTHAIGLTDVTYENKSFKEFPNTTITRSTNQKQLVTLFFNTQDPVLSDKKVRSGLSYALPNSFVEGERIYVPYPKDSLYFNHDLENKIQDLSHANLLLDASIEQASGSALPKLTIATLPKYKKIAEIIAKEWKKVQVNTEIQEVDTVPQTFQIYLGDFMVPRDPDQYTLWHSDQVNNITKFRNLRIDKLLEDGRKRTDINERKVIYADFQKYLLDETPAAFLYFPYEYDITRS